MLRKVVVGVRAAADWEDEIVAVVGETQVFVVAGVKSALEAQRQHSVLIRHRGVVHALCCVFHWLRIARAREPVKAANRQH